MAVLLIQASWRTLERYVAARAVGPVARLPEPPSQLVGVARVPELRGPRALLSGLHGVARSIPRVACGSPRREGALHILVAQLQLAAELRGELRVDVRIGPHCGADRPAPSSRASSSAISRQLTHHGSPPSRCSARKSARGRSSPQAWHVTRTSSGSGGRRPGVASVMSRPLGGRRPGRRGGRSRGHARADENCAGSRTRRGDATHGQGHGVIEAPRGFQVRPAARAVSTQTSAGRWADPRAGPTQGCPGATRQGEATSPRGHPTQWSPRRPLPSST